MLSGIPRHKSQIIITKQRIENYETLQNDNKQMRNSYNKKDENLTANHNNKQLNVTHKCTQYKQTNRTS